MLVLSRHLYESIIITVPPSDVSQTIRVSLVRISTPEKARIGFEADKEITILREELTEEELSHSDSAPHG